MLATPTCRCHLKFEYFLPLIRVNNWSTLLNIVRNSVQNPLHLVIGQLVLVVVPAPSGSMRGALLIRLCVRSTVYVWTTTKPSSYFQLGTFTTQTGVTLLLKFFIKQIIEIPHNSLNGMWPWSYRTTTLHMCPCDARVCIKHNLVKTPPRSQSACLGLYVDIDHLASCQSSACCHHATQTHPCPQCTTYSTDTSRPLTIVKGTETRTMNESGREMTTNIFWIQHRPVCVYPFCVSV